MRKCNPHVIHEFFERVLHDTSWPTSFFFDLRKDLYSSFNKRVKVALHVCRYQKPRPFDSNKFISQQREFYLGTVMPNYVLPVFLSMCVFTSTHNSSEHPKELVRD